VAKTTQERFFEKVVKDKFTNTEFPDLGPCWLYQGGRNRGYGVFWNDDRKSVSAHRFSYELANGPIPDGLQLDHLCYTRNCVRPDHLEPVTGKENLRRSRGAVHYIVLSD